MTRFFTVAALCVLATAAGAETDRKSAQSVVQIRCTIDAGEMKATGFVWPEPGYVVTALHAVAGCGSGEGLVYSQHARRETEFAEIVAVDLEADLALIRLAADLGLIAVPLAKNPPDTRATHFVWGYPLAAESLIDLRVEFAGGLEGGVTTLGSAFSSGDLSKLFRDQSYPNRETRILRVTTTIQPGHSGAPIFDTEGRVVAIADGGLLGGWRGINWSIPAHVYLADLPVSDDPLPEAASHQAELFSAYAVEEDVVIPLGNGGRLDPSPDDAPVTLARVGQIPLSAVIDILGVEDDDEMAWIVDEIEAILPDRSSWELFLFDALQDTRDGAIYVVPARSTVHLDADTGILEALSIDGAASQFLFVHTADDFDAAVETGERSLLDRARALGPLQRLPERIPREWVDRELEFVEYDDYLESSDGRVEVSLYAQANGPHFFGGGVARSRHPDDMSDADWVDFMMMDLALYDLNGFFPLDEELEEYLSSPDLSDTSFSPKPSALTLVRRVPLSDVAEDFVADRNFEWKSDLADLKAELDDPSEFEDLIFDVYEDQATGATIAVPSGLELRWNEELGAAEAVYGGGNLHLAIAIHSTPTFRAATGAGPARFVESLSKLAEWTDEGPAACRLAIYASDRTADCWGYFEGTDRRTGEFADVYLALTVEENVFLGTSVYIVGEQEDLTGDEIITYLMMLIGAEYLSDFAAK
jgi:hypothetical protein